MSTNPVKNRSAPGFAGSSENSVEGQDQTDNTNDKEEKSESKIEKIKEKLGAK